MLMTADEKKDARLKIYSDALNRIDDYFEYRNKSAEDKEYVRKVLSSVTSKLELLYPKSEGE